MVRVFRARADWPAGKCVASSVLQMHMSYKCTPVLQTHTDVRRIPNKSSAQPSLSFGPFRAKWARYPERTPLSMPRVLAVGVLMLSAGHVFGQSSDQSGAQANTPRPEFEVASIKPNKSADMRIMVRPAPGGRFTATNIPLQFLITLARNLREFGEQK